MDGADRFSAGLIVRLAGTEREVNAECDPRRPIAELLDAILNEVGLPPGGDLYVARTGRRLMRDQALATQPLAHGDVLSTEPIEPDNAPLPVAEHELMGTGGAAMGARWALVPGRDRVGRSRECEVVVDDPALSRIHLTLRVEGEDVFVGDAGSTNGTFIEGVRLDGERRLEADDVIEAGGCLFTVARVHTERGRRSVPDRDGFIRFNRPPRVTSPASKTQITIPPPPAQSSAPRLPLASALLPLLAGLALWRLFPGNPSLLLVLTLSPLMALFSIVDERRRGRGLARSDEDRWRRELTEILETLGAERANAIRSDRDLAPSVTDLETAVAGQTPELWLRRPSDPDFLLLRWGWGDRRWDADVSLGAGGSDALRKEVRAQLEPLLTLPSVPLTVALGELGVIGLVGDAPRVSDLIRWWLIQLVTLHSPEDVSLALLVPETEADEWGWTTWLPHGPNEVWEGSLRPAIEQLRVVLNLLEARQASLAAAPRVVVILDERARLPRSLTSRLAREGPAHGIHVVWHANRREDLPGECAAIVEVDDDGTGLTIVSTGDKTAGAFEGVAAEIGRRIATTLAPMRDVAPRSAAAAVPGRLSLFDALEVERPDPAWVTGRWRGSDDGARAPIGRSAKGPYVIDLIEDGPHALVGGTTGSGKSELLQTIVAALAVTYPPDHLNFLLVDYKGGAAFKDCERLPHTVGSVTDLDDHLANRALISLDAEVRRRETMLRQAGVRDVAELEAAGASTIPRLVLLVDEFATLIRELPDFVDGVVDLAQRGRSLGIHVVLATQRPAGIVNEAIRANTNLRVALRVADEADSENVIGTREAAHVPRSLPGRAYARTGHTEVEEMQCAFGGTRRQGGQSVLVWDRTSGAPPREDAGSGPTQLERLVAVLEETMCVEGLEVPRRLWLPPLPATLALSDLEPPTSKTPVAVIGLTDLPQLQSQEVCTFDPKAHGGMAVFGSGGSGKTTVLRTIAASLATSASADRIHLYAIDHSGGGLHALQHLPHVGDVVTGDEPERVERLFHRVRSEVDRRMRAAANGSERLPMIVVLLDGYAGFAATFERIDAGALVDGFPSLVSEGRSVGIHFVVTAERRAALPQALVSALGQRLILRMGEADEYAALGLEGRKLRDAHLPPGRGFFGGTELQVATPSGTDSPEADEDAMKRLAEALPRCTHEPARVRMLPREVALAGLATPDGPFRAVLGLVAGDELHPAVVDLGPAHFLAAGPYRSGRSTALAALVASLRSTTPEASFHLLAPRRSPLRELTVWSRAAEGVDMCTSDIDELSAAIGKDPDDPRVVVIDDAEELLDGPASYALEPLIRRARDGATRFVVAGETKAIHRAFTGWITEVRKDKQGLLLDPDPDIDGDLFGVRLPRRRETASPGRGYLIHGGEIEPIQVARP